MGKAVDGEQIESKTLLFEKSPYGNIDAIVESDGRTVYFYLQGDEAFGLRSCWVKNLIPGPLAFNEQDLQFGRAPVLPRIHLVTPRPGKEPESEALEVVWFAEGNGAALCEGAAVLAVIPPWSGTEGFHGYAAGCASENLVCWPMPSQPALQQRIESSRQFWADWKEGSRFSRIQSQQLAAYHQRFGTEVAYFAIDGDAFPPRGLARYDSPDRIVLITVGMSLCPQPMVEMAVDQPREVRRVELAVSLSAGSDDEDVLRAAKRLSSLASLPWRQWTWLGHQHTCDWFGEGSKLPIAGMCRDSSESGGARALVNQHWELPEVDGDPVYLLWVIPCSKDELASVRNGERQWLDLLI